MLKLIRNNLLYSQNRMAQQVNTKRSERVFYVGDFSLYKATTIPTTIHSQSDFS